METSTVNGRALGPISLATRAAVWPFRSATSTFAPSRAKRLHIAAPNPEPPPVTMIFLSFSRMVAVLCESVRSEAVGGLYDFGGNGAPKGQMARYERNDRSGLWGRKRLGATRRESEQAGADPPRPDEDRRAADADARDMIAEVAPSG